MSHAINAAGSPAPTGREAALEGREVALEAALREALLVIQDYLDYSHDGDPTVEDARTMGEMEVDDYGRDGRMAAAQALLASPGMTQDSLPTSPGMRS